jgi:predicted  nucleic acid-binding Zn-ribbon protein
MMNHYQQQLKLLEVSQKSTLDAVEKYRLIEREFHDYRTESERKVERLVRENEQLKQFEPEDKAYDQEISSLRKELHRLSQTQHSPSIDPLYEEETSVLKSQVRQLMVER